MMKTPTTAALTYCLFMMLAPGKSLTELWQRAAPGSIRVLGPNASEVGPQARQPGERFAQRQRALAGLGLRPRVPDRVLPRGKAPRNQFQPFDAPMSKISIQPIDQHPRLMLQQHCRAGFAFE